MMREPQQPQTTISLGNIEDAISSAHMKMETLLIATPDLIICVLKGSDKRHRQDELLDVMGHNIGVQNIGMQKVCVGKSSNGLKKF